MPVITEASRRRADPPGKGDGRPPGPGDAPGGPLRRFGWFVLLWFAGVAATGAVGFLIRAALKP